MLLVTHKITKKLHILNPNYVIQIVAKDTGSEITTQLNGANYRIRVVEDIVTIWNQINKKS